MSWSFDDKFKPTAVGWYAALKCWDPEEGLFPDALYWDGAKWLNQTRASYSFMPEVFPTAEEAKAWAYKHDPDA